MFILVPLIFFSHIQGMFNRTIRMLSAGVKPVFVFDGKPPVMKSGEVSPLRQYHYDVCTISKALSRS